MAGAAKTVRVRIDGRVQGVWFRAWAKQEAESRGLLGWVRNRADGTVEALFRGPAEAVDDMVAACRRGPAAARVADVTASAADDAGLDGFQLWPTV